MSTEKFSEKTKKTWEMSDDKSGEESVRDDTVWTDQSVTPLILRDNRWQINLKYLGYQMCQTWFLIYQIEDEWFTTINARSLSQFCQFSCNQNKSGEHHHWNTAAAVGY